ncbi:RNA polymerase-binding protein RbpA [Lentzea sp. NBRC 105346]|uniref:RNA polymerase-binding protein RbpA n=1 Tax=Lentzea sp. NBRC 105346 TaxID=3032205 RepID=UPI00249F9FE6|nr:RNA polymerase-binding protein RbpA [Lentzea sp. NBRC 105346]GLZ28089.1 RNA polymerase-binding protein RbpA [Lentzea sp. NBRC 105346]
MSRVFAGRAPWGTSQTPGEPECTGSAPRWVEIFECPAGHEFEMQFAHDADLPDTWECRNHGHESQRLAVRSTPKVVKPPRTHWDMLLERRSIEDLEVLLDERLEKLRADRRAGRANLD